MRRAAAAVALAGLAAVTACSGSGAAARHRPPPARYYLALGDSLSQGVQPNAAGISVRTGHGYPDLLYATLRRRQPGLRLVKLGCPDETTVTMINGGICHYPGGSQLAAAVSFLRAHRGRVSLITLDIGANDVESCLSSSPATLAVCAGRSIPDAVSNVATILRRLRQAAPGVHAIAMNYYLPTLAEWRHGFGGQIVARLSEMAAGGYNDLLERAFHTAGVRVADVYGAFHTVSFSPRVSVPGLGSLPRNVAAICQWTWECAPPPRGPNQHPNQAGYRVIANAFLAADPAPSGAQPAPSGA